MHESNFFFDTNNNMCTVDFEFVGILPLSFASYTLHSGKNTFAREVAKYLDWLPTSNLYSMARVLWTIGNQTLGAYLSVIRFQHRTRVTGLDKDGRLKARR